MRKRTLKPINKFGEVLSKYLESQDMTYTDLSIKICGRFCAQVQQWIVGLKTKEGYRVVYPDAMSLKTLSNVMPASWFKELWDTIPAKKGE